MTVRVAVDSKIAEEVTVTCCQRVPRVGQRFIVTFGEAVLDFGLVKQILEISEDSPEVGSNQGDLPWMS